MLDGDPAAPPLVLVVPVQGLADHRLPGVGVGVQFVEEGLVDLAVAGVDPGFDRRLLRCRNARARDLRRRYRALPAHPALRTGAAGSRPPGALRLPAGD